MNIVVSGASRGIGRALVKKFLHHGNHKVFAFARQCDLLESLNHELIEEGKNGNFYYQSFDLKSGNIKDELFPAIQNDMGSIDILINNAGQLINKPFENLTDDDFDQTFDINVKGVFKLTRDLIPLYKKNTHIINISSMGGFQGSAKFPGLSLYSASKGAVAILTECLAEEFKERGVSVNSLAIGAVQTEMLEEAFPGYKAPLSSEEMADFIVDFAINGHKYYNGKILPVSSSTP